MTTPTGTISMSDVNTELSKASTALISLNDGDVRNLAGKASGIISMDDLRGKSAVNYGSITSNFSIRAEGQSFTFTISGGTAIPNGTYYWRVVTVTNMDSADFSATSGSFTISSNTGSFTVTTVDDALDEGNGTFYVVVGNASGVPVTFVTGPTVTVTETTTYSFTATSATRYRFGPASFRNYTLTANTTKVANGTVLYWSIVSVSGTVGSTEVSALTGTLTINSNTGSYSGTVTEVTNGSSIPAKSFKFRVFKDSGRTQQVGESGPVGIEAAPTFSLSFSPTSIAEGQASTWTLSTGGVPEGSTLYYTITGTGATSDVLGLASSGSMTTPFSSTITGTWWAALDGVSESTESLTLNIKTVSTSGTTVASASVSITNATPSIGTVTATRTDGATPGSAVKIFFSASGIPAYGASRTFNITYSLEGAAFTTAGLITTSVTLPAFSTSIPSTKIYDAPGGGTNLVESSKQGLRVRLTGTGQADTISAPIYGFYI